MYSLIFEIFGMFILFTIFFFSFFFNLLFVGLVYNMETLGKTKCLEFLSKSWVFEHYKTFRMSLNLRESYTRAVNYTAYMQASGFTFMLFSFT